MSIPTHSAFAAGLLDRDRWALLAERIAIALVISLPWSTSLTGVLAVVWLIALAPSLPWSAVRRELLTPAGGLPVLLFAFGAVGMLWADVPMSDRLNGIGGYAKLLVIPLLLAQFRQRGGGRWVLYAFLGSCTVLLALSWMLWIAGAHPWPTRDPFVPVKDRISQGAMFAVCIAMLADLAIDFWRQRKHQIALALVVLALAFMGNVFAIATSRTAIVVIPILLLLIGCMRLSWKGVGGLALALVVIAAAAWPLAGPLRNRISSIPDEIATYREAKTSAGERVEFWRKSIGFIAAAPLIGHGTGAIRDQFQKAAAQQSGVVALASHNPHNQTFAVAIEIGLLGAAVLWAMWMAHLLLFVGQGLAARIGLLIVVQNVIGSLFNSHLFDFTHGWAYVLGVGIAGGLVLHSRDGAARHENGLPQVPL